MSKSTILLICQLGALQFIVLTTTAMLIYPGGSLFNPNEDRYSFKYNFFSDLGRTKSISGQNNILGYLLFASAMVIAGSSIVIINGINYSVDKSELSSNASYSGIIAGIFIILTGIIPVDLMLLAHNFIIMIAFLFTLISVSLYSKLFIQKQDYSKHYGISFFVFAIMILIYLLMVIQGNAINSRRELYVQVIAQKIIVYTMILLYLNHSKGFATFLRSKEFKFTEDRKQFNQDMQMMKPKVQLELQHKNDGVMNDIFNRYWL